MTSGRMSVLSPSERKEELDRSINRKEEKKLGIKKLFKRFIQDEEGATAVEYAVMIVLIIVVCLATITLLGGEVEKSFNAIATTMAWRTS